MKLKLLIVTICVCLFLKTQAQVRVYGFGKDTVLGSSATISPNERAIRNYVDASVAGTDTNTVKYGSIRTTQTNSPFYAGTYATLKNRKYYVDDYKVTAYGSYSISLTDSCSATYNFKKIVDGGGGTFIVYGSPGLANNKRVKSTIYVDNYTQDSAMSIASGFNNNATLYLHGSTVNRDLNFEMTSGTYYGFTRPFSFAGSTNMNVHAHINQLYQWLPQVIFASGDNGLGFMAGLSGTYTNSNILIEIDEASFMDNGILFNAALVNSTVTIRVKNAKRNAVNRWTPTDAMIYIGGSTDATSRVIIEGNFYADSKSIVDVAANVNVVLKGTFETLSTTEAAIKLSATAPNVKIQGLLKTGFTESISASAARSISILAGSSSNKAVGANVTQVGGTLTVNAGY